MTSKQWGTRKRLDAWLNSCRRDGELGTSVRIDFELVKEALAEIERLTRGWDQCRELLRQQTEDITPLREQVERLRAALEDAQKWLIELGKRHADELPLGACDSGQGEQSPTRRPADETTGEPK